MSEPEPDPVQEAIGLARLLRELLRTQPAATGALVSERLLPVVDRLLEALRRAARR